MKGPFLKDKLKTNKIMLNLLISLVPLILFSFYKNGIVLYKEGYVGIIEMFYPLIFILIGTLSSLLIEELYLYVFNKKRGKELIDSIINGYGIFPGLFLSLILPINTPLAVLFIGSLVATIVGKMIYGGFGNNIFNPALIGCLFIMTCYGTVISTNGGYINAYELDTVGSATPLTNVSLIESIGTYDTLVSPYGNLLDFFIGTIPGAVGETSALLCLVGFIYLTLTKTIKWRIPVTYISTVFIMTLIIGLFNGLGIWYPLFQILSGGLFLGAIFMATDPVTSPTTSNGQILYGICLGLLTTVLRYLTSYPEGVLTSILIMNMFVFIIDKVSSKLRLKTNINNIVIVSLVFIVLLSSYGISTIYAKGSEQTDANFTIISKNENNNEITYEVSQKGFGGKIKASIVIKDNKVTSITIKEHNESQDRWKLIDDQKYIDKLIKEQSNLTNVDTVSSATVTSSALKKMIINTLADFKGEEIVEEKKVTILNTEQVDDFTIYNVETPSFGGNMQIEVVMKDNLIRTFIPMKYNDTCVTKTKTNAYYTCPSFMDEGYIDSLIVNQDNLGSVDTVSGATISSTALKETMKEMKEVGLNE